MKTSFALRLSAICIFVSCGAAVAVAQETRVAQVGAWSVYAISERGVFHRCAAELKSNNGALRVANIANGTWAMSFPGYGTRLQQVGAVRLNRLEAPRVVVTDHGARASTPLSLRWVDEFRRGGVLQVAAARRNYAWDMRGDTAAALGAVQNCVAQRRGTVAVAAPRFIGFGQPRVRGYAPPPPPPQVIVVQTPAPAPAQPRLAAAPVAAPAPAAAPMADPVATVKYVYANIDKPRTEPFSKKLATLRQAAEKRSEELKEPVAGLDFDYAINGQDSEPDLGKSVRYQILGQDAKRASIKATFKNGDPVELRYDLTFEDGKWLIDEVWQIGGDGWALSDLLKEGAATK